MRFRQGVNLHCCEVSLTDSTLYFCWSLAVHVEEGRKEPQPHVAHVFQGDLQNAFLTKICFDRFFAIRV